MQTGERVGRCPECGAGLGQTDPRFVTWCANCDWNVEPSKAGDKPPGTIGRYRRRLEERLVKALFEEIRDKRELKPGKDLAATAAVVVAAVIHLLTLAMLVAGVWILVSSWRNPFAWLPALGLIGAAIAMRPRFPKLPKDSLVLTRSDAPNLYALVDRVTDELGGPRLQHLAVDGEFNATSVRYGLRRVPVLTIGVPLWTVLRPQERVDLLGHEIGHFVNNDSRHTLVVGTALNAVSELYGLLVADVRWDEDLAFFTLVSRAFLRFLALGPQALYVVLGLLTLRAGQRAEYLADQLGSRVGSSRATVAGFDASLLGRPAMNTIATAVRRREEPDELWRIEREYIQSVPPTERERLRRVAVRQDSRVDRSHLPTHLRIKLAEARPQLAAAVVLGRPESERIDQELAPAYSQVARSLREEILRGMYY